MYKIVYSNQAKKDAKKLTQSGLDAKAKALIEILKEDPYKTPPDFEKLVGDLQGFFSRRINAKHRLVYKIIESEKTVLIARMWTHYE